MYHYTSCGLDNVRLKNGYVITNSGYGETVSIHNLDGLHKAIAIGIVKGSLPLTGKEFRFLRIELDLSQKALGNLMEKSDQAIASWEKDQQDLPRLADKALRDLYMESIGDSPVSGLLEELSKLDRQLHELTLELEESHGDWGSSLTA